MTIDGLIAAQGWLLSDSLDHRHRSEAVLRNTCTNETLKTSLFIQHEISRAERDKLVEQAHPARKVRVRA